MIEILSVENMRASDAATIAGGISGRELMARAGASIFNAAPWQGPVAIVCGTGNNAGDGYVLAILLKGAGVPCELFLTEEKFSEDGKYYFEQCQEIEIPVRIADENGFSEDFDDFNTIVDCIYGTGFHGEISRKIENIISAINHSKAFKISVDINSGLNGNNGLTSNACVESDLTISIGSYQPGHFLNAAKDVMKERVNCPIGIKAASAPFELLEASDVATALPERKNFSNKGTYGYVTLIGGSNRYCGAIRLAAMAQSALMSGAGVATIAVPGSIANVVATNVLESTIYHMGDMEGELAYDPAALAEITKNRKAVAFGMGVGTGDGARESLVWLLENYEGRLIVDADGLNLLSELPEGTIIGSKPELILTPHVKEFSRLLAGLTGQETSVRQVLHDPINLAKDYAGKVGAVVLLKGPTTIITDGERVILSDTGCPGMATAGSGDVLSGVCAGTASFVESVIMAAAAAAYVNGLAGELAQAKTNYISQLASDTAAEIPAAVTEILNKN